MPKDSEPQIQMDVEHPASDADLEGLREEVKHDENEAVKCIPSREAAQGTEVEDMQGEEHRRLQQQLKPIVREIKKLSTRCKRQQIEIHQIRRQLVQKCNCLNEMDTTIKQREQTIEKMARQNVALNQQNMKLKATMRKAAKVQTEGLSMINALRYRLSRAQAEKEVALKKITELEKLVSDTEQVWAAKYEAEVKLLTLKNSKLQELASMTDKTKINKEQKTAKEEVEKGLKKKREEESAENKEELKKMKRDG